MILSGAEDPARVC